MTIQFQSFISNDTSRTKPITHVMQNKLDGVSKVSDQKLTIQNNYVICYKGHFIFMLGIAVVYPEIICVISGFGVNIKH